jgi:hypothetical protein
MCHSSTPLGEAVPYPISTAPNRGPLCRGHDRSSHAVPVGRAGPFLGARASCALGFLSRQNLLVTQGSDRPADWAVPARQSRQVARHAEDALRATDHCRKQWATAATTRRRASVGLGRTTLGANARFTADEGLAQLFSADRHVIALTSFQTYTEDAADESQGCRDTCRHVATKFSF